MFKYLLVFLLLASPLYAQDYCKVKEKFYPCELLLIIRAPDGTVNWVIKFNKDGTEEVIFEAKTPKEGLSEAKENEKS